MYYFNNYLIRCIFYYRYYYHAATKRFSLFPPSIHNTLTDFNPRDDVDI